MHNKKPKGLRTNYEKNCDTIIIESESEKEQYRNSYLHLHTIGFSKTSNHMFSRSSPLTDYLFTIILDGNGHYSRDENKNIKHKFDTGDLIVFKPGDFFHICPKGDVGRLWFHVLGTAIPEILTTIPLDEKNYCMNLSVEKRNNFLELFDELFLSISKRPLD